MSRLRTAATVADQQIVEEWLEVRLRGLPPGGKPYDFTFRSNQDHWVHLDAFLGHTTADWSNVRVEHRAVRRQTRTSEWAPGPPGTGQREEPAGFPATIVPTHGPDSPEDGHTWDVAVSSRGSYGGPDGVHRDSQFWSGHIRARVRAFDLPAALRAAAAMQLADWRDDDGRRLGDEDGDDRG